MVQRSVRILVVDDQRDNRQLTADILVAEGHSVDTAESGPQGLEKLAEGGFDLVILDYFMPQMNGLEALQCMRQMPEADDVLVVMLTSYASYESAVEAVKLGAYDYISRPADIDELRLRVRRAIEALTLRRQNRYLQGELKKGCGFHDIVAESSRMMDVLHLIQEVADTEATVLIQGESGTGKELVAREIHAQSSRRSRTMVTVNCPAIPETLFESEFFGHVKGAFTGATTHRMGRFKEADGSTLFLDEVSEIPLDLQSKLLRVLQEGAFEIVGDNRTHRVNTRIIAATNRDLHQYVKEGGFREDLYYRLNPFPIGVPPLRERKEDIPSLVHHFLEKYNGAVKRTIKGVSEKAMSLLLSYDYPGNVRELENIIERAVILTKNDTIQPRVFPPELHHPSISDAPPSWLSQTFQCAKEQFEREYVQVILKEAEGNISEAARRAGMDRKNFKEKISKHHIEADSYRIP